jgi:signal peptidase I
MGGAAGLELETRRRVALILGLSVPGLGHVYVGQPVRGALWAGLPVGALVAGLYLFVAGSGSLGVGLAALGLAALPGSVLALALASRDSYRPLVAARIATHAVLVMLGTPVLALCVRAALVEAFKIPGGSMMPTLLVGDRLVVDKLALRGRLPERGDAIVFEFPEDPEQDFIKRVIALPGDTLEVREGRAFLNGWPVPRCRLGEAAMPAGARGERPAAGEVFVEFLGSHAYLTLVDWKMVPRGNSAPLVARPGEVLVLGDNRDNSYDSRLWFGGKGGGVPVGNIIGRAAVIWLSVAAQGGTRPGRAGERLGGEPQLPPGLEGLRPALEACLRERPAAAQASPPR